MGYLGATLTRVCSRTFVRRADVSLRDVTIAQKGNGGYRVRVTSCTRSAQRIWGILKKSVSWVEFCLWRRQLAFACSPKPGQWPLWWVPHVLGGGGRWKSQNRKNVYLSPYVQEPLNSKVIKSSYLNWEVVTCFSNFEIPMFYLYGHSMYVSHIAISWLWYKESGRRQEEKRKETWTLLNSA